MNSAIDLQATQISGLRISEKSEAGSIQNSRDGIKMPRKAGH